MTRDTKTTTGEKTYTTDSSSWDAAPLLKLLGVGSSSTQVTVSSLDTNSPEGAGSPDSRAVRS